MSHCDSATFERVRKDEDYFYYFKKWSSIPSVVSVCSNPAAFEVSVLRSHLFLSFSNENILKIMYS